LEDRTLDEMTDPISSPIDDTGYAVLDERSIKVDQQAQSFVGQPQIGKKLLL
jgi:hypothetical protein